MQLWKEVGGEWQKRRLPERFSSARPSDPLWEMVQGILLRHKGEGTYWIVFSRAEERDIARWARPFFGDASQPVAPAAFVRTLQAVVVGPLKNSSIHSPVLPKPEMLNVDLSRNTTRNRRLALRVDG
jgi:hypothetical protein